MQKRTFKGGTHPPQCKYTEDKKIEELPPPEIVTIPLHQHTGAPSEPLVKKGDHVKVGTRIGEARGFISAAIHSSISGTVREVGECIHPVTGAPSQAVVIEGDGENLWDESVKPRENYLDLEPEKLIEIVKDSGIVGLGGAAFPTHVKLSPPKDKPIDVVILNGAECEPYLTSDHRLMLEKTKEIAEGGKIILKILGCKRGFIGIEANKPDAISAFGSEPGNQFEVVPLKVKYPQGQEHYIIDAIVHREIPSGGLPMDIGVLVQNVGTAFAIYEAVKLGRPLLQRVVTVTGSAIREPKNLLVRIGTPFSDLFESCGGIRESVRKILMGGPMMGIAVFTDEVPVVKGTSGIVALDEKDAREFAEQPCIRCARCVDACPMRLVPTTIADFARLEMLEDAERMGIMDCKECGTCSYVCPSRRNLVHYMKQGKATIFQKRRKKKSA
ncbi:MAG: electron transport complex subunit RsxC [bacterium]